MEQKSQNHTRELENSSTKETASQQTQLPTTPLEIANWIKDTTEEVKYGSDIISVTMDLPPGNRVGHDNLCKALEMVLREYFIAIPQEIKEEISKGEDDIFSFLAPAQESYLKPRDVEINTLPGISSLSIKGVEPVEGENGFYEVFFDFKVRPGKERPDGTIDFRDVNRFPQAAKDQKILRAYSPSDGIPGTDIYGFAIKPKPGLIQPLKISEGFYIKEGIDSKTNRAFKDYFCQKPGIIICSFSGEPELENLTEISIKNEIRVKNIDFSTGNFKSDTNEFRCKADLIVEGDIKGCFSVIIDGNLTVKGAVEGENIDATGRIIVSFAKNKIRSGNDMEVGIARNANLIAKGTVLIKRELADTTIKAREIVLSPKGVPELLLGKAVLNANQVVGTGVSIRNVLEINLGESLFELDRQLKKQKGELEKKIAKSADALRARGAVFGEKLALAKNVLDQQQKKVLPILKQFASMILMGNVSHEKIRSRMDNITSTLGSEYFNLIKHLTKMVNIHEELTDLYEKFDVLKKHISETEEAISKIKVELKGRITGAGQIILNCGGFSKKWTSRDVDNEYFHLSMSFDPAKGVKVSLLPG